MITPTKAKSREREAGPTHTTQSKLTFQSFVPDNPLLPELLDGEGVRACRSLVRDWADNCVEGETNVGTDLSKGRSCVCICV
jgi:hypothetical protein